MKRFILALAALGTLTIGTMATANAFEFGVGPGGVHFGPGYYHDYGYYGEGCRVVVTHRFNRFGDRVVVHRRVCDSVESLVPIEHDPLANARAGDPQSPVQPRRDTVPGLPNQTPPDIRG